MNTDVLIIGGGPAGLMCAITAAKQGRSVHLLEHNDRIGKKILVSGGGRCNFTNLHVSSENYLSQHPDFCKSALARLTPKDMLAFAEQHHIAYHEKKLGQIFCDESARQITDALLEECHSSGVKISLRTLVQDIEIKDHFYVHTNRGVLESESLVVATGGLSFPSLGAKDFGYRMAEKWGLKMMEVRPALVPLILHAQDIQVYKKLSGISIHASVSCGKRKFKENILFTHRGLSGPAILQISSYWKEGQPLQIDLSPDLNLEKYLLENQQKRAELINILSEHLPRRFLQVWCEKNFPSKPIHQISIKKLREIAHQLHHWEVFPKTTEGYEKAEVTLGGVDTKEFSSQTMECKRIPKLYFIGEVLDVTGHLGGYNLHWAWASGFAAGQNV